MRPGKHYRRDETPSFLRGATGKALHLASPAGGGQARQKVNHGGQARFLFNSNSCLMFTIVATFQISYMEGGTVNACGCLLLGAKDTHD